MSNRETADFLAENINESLKYIWLCHLSKDNNHPELAYKTVELSLRNKRDYRWQRCASHCLKAEYAFRYL